MRFRALDSFAADLFLTHVPRTPLAACIGLSDESGEPLRLPFRESEHSNVMIVGRSGAAAFGIFSSMLLDLASQILTTPDRREIYTTPPFSILDFCGDEESRIFTNAAMSLPVPVKLEYATDTALNTLTDFQFELSRRQREPSAPRHAKFLFLCGLQAAHGVRARGFYASPDANPLAARFSQLLRAGAAQSLHTIICCNSFTNIDLTLADGIDSFDHVIILNDAGIPSGQISSIEIESTDQAWYINVRQNSVTPLIPFTVPSQAWCDAVIRTLAN